MELADCQHGKFRNFYELGKCFGYFGNFIYVSFHWLENHEYDYFKNETYGNDGEAEFFAHVFYKDKKDPLNRLGGLFDGKTYGKGRFILVTNREEFLKTIKCEECFGEHEPNEETQQAF